MPETEMEAEAEAEAGAEAEAEAEAEVETEVATEPDEGHEAPPGPDAGREAAAARESDEAVDEPGDSQAADTATPPVPWQPIVRRWQLPIAVATLALLIGVVARLGVHWSTLPVLAFASTAVVLAVIDFAVLRLPNALTGPTALAVAASLVAQALAEGRPRLLVTELEGAAGVAGFYLLLFVLSRGGLGFGDVKVGAVAGMLLASRDWGHVLNGTFLAYVITLVVAVVLMLRKRKKFPYGPGLLAGTIAVLL